MVLYEVIVKGLVYGCMYALMAVGLTMVYGLLRILHIAHASIFTLGAYAGLLTANQTGSLALGILAAILTAGVAGVLIYRFAYEPVLREPPHVAMIISIGLLIMMEDGFRIVFGGYGVAFRHNPWYTGTVHLAGINFTQAELAMVGAAVVLLGALGFAASRTRIGVGWRATVTDPQMAASFGVDPMRVRYLSFFIGSALAAVAGLSVGVLINYVEPGMGASLSYKGLAIVVLGGLGNVRGTLWAGLALGVIEGVGGLYLSDVLDRNAIGFAVLIAALMVRP